MNLDPGLAEPRLTPRGLAAIVNRMGSPVICRWCSTIYDLQTVRVTGRYLDCSVWRSPCCNTQVDDRAVKNPPDFERVGERTIHRLLAPTDIYGTRRTIYVLPGDGTILST